MKKVLGILRLSLLFSFNSVAYGKVELICKMYEITMDNKRDPFDGGTRILILDLKTKVIEGGPWSGGGQITSITNEKINAEPRPDQFSDSFDRWFTLNRYTGELTSFLNKPNGESTFFHSKCKPGKQLF